DQRAGTVRFRACGDRDTLFLKARDKTRIARRIGLEGRTIVSKSAANPLAGDRDRFHATVGYVVYKLRIGNFTGIGALTWALEQVEQRNQKKSNDRPEGEVAIVRIHIGSNRYHGHSAGTERCFGLT